MEKESPQDLPLRNVEQYAMPWLHLIDSNGELPWNYEEILANERKEKEAAQRKEHVKQETESEKQARLEAIVKQCHMPWLHLIDGVTGELPKNYKYLLAQEQKRKKEENNDSKIAGEIVDELNSCSKLSHPESNKKTNKLPNKKSSAKPIIFKTPILASASFVGAKVSNKNKKPSTTSHKADNKKLTVNTKRVTVPKNIIKSPSLQIESHPRRQLFTSTPGTKQKPSKSPSPLADSVLNSTAKYIQLESSLQTPKAKLNSLQKFEAYIKQTDNSIKRRLDDLKELKEIYNTMKVEATSNLKLKDSNNTKLNLRIGVLKQTFDLNGNKNKKPSTTSHKTDNKKLTVNTKRINVPKNIESPSLQIESHPRRQLFTSTPDMKQTPLKSPSPLADSVLNSTAKFIQLESSLQTPKAKLNSLQKFEACIKQTEKSIKSELDALNELKEIYNTMKAEATSNLMLKDSNSTKLNLRIGVLKQTFDLNEKENNNALNRYINLKSDIQLLQTPDYRSINNMRSNISKKVMHQCLMLEDTPKK